MIAWLRDRPEDVDAAIAGYRASAARARRSTLARTSNGVFQAEGDVWNLEFGRSTVVVPDAKGLHDLHTLLSNPGREISAIDLLHAGSPDHASANRRLRADPVLDEQARAEYRARLEQLDEKIDRATARHADNRAAELDAERAALLHELRAATGLGGRRRTLGDEPERARKTVTARIRDTLRRLDERHPALFDHLRASITTGTYCCYRDERTTWTL